MENLRNLNEIAALSIRLRRPDWDVLRFPAASLNPTGPVQAPAVDPDTGALIFVPSQIQRMTGTSGFPHDMKIGGTVVPVIHFKGTSATPGDVVFEFRYSYAAIGEEFTAFATKQYVYSNPGDGEHLILLFDEVETRPLTEMGEMITVGVSRVGSDAGDTYPGDIHIYELTVAYQRDGFGSEEILTKLRG